MKATSAILVLGAAYSTHALSQPKLEHTPITYEVCLSPGCVADGAHQTLEAMQALAPPGCTITSGVCCSLCGNGPVVMTPEEKKPRKYRRVKDSKILEILLEELGDEEHQHIPETLIDGFKLSEKAEHAFLQQDFSEATTLYEKAIEVAFQPALELQAEREQHNCFTSSDNGIPFGLLWLVKARRNEAISKLALGDLDGALLASKAGCDVAQNRCSESLEVLAEILNKSGDARGELEALTILFDLPVDEKALSNTQTANKRRQLGFRKQKLEREVAS